MVPYNGVVYAGTQAGGIIGLDEKTGARVYYYPTEHPHPTFARHTGWDYLFCYEWWVDPCRSLTCRADSCEKLTDELIINQAQEPQKFAL